MSADPIPDTPASPAFAPRYPQPKDPDAHTRLRYAILRGLANGRHPPCWDNPPLWISEYGDDLAEAAAACAGCAVMDACRHAGACELAGVWGGVIRTERPKHRRPKVAS